MRYSEITEGLTDQRSKEMARKREAVQSANQKKSENLTRYQIKMRAADDRARLAKLDSDPARVAERLKSVDRQRAAARKIYGDRNTSANSSTDEYVSGD